MRENKCGPKSAPNRDCRRTAAIVLAAGQGKRMQSAVAKQFLLLGGKPLIYYALAAFEKSPVERIVLVTGAEEIGWCRREVAERYGFSKISEIVPGGSERYHSVYEGLKALSGSLSEDDIVLIHDGARPLVDQAVIERAIAGAKKYEACVAAMPVKDTIKIADTAGFSSATPDRSLLWQIQTPQAFSYGLIFDSYRKLFLDPAAQAGITDDAMAAERMAGKKVKLIEGSYQNLKVTTPEDLVIAEALLRQRTDA